MPFNQSLATPVRPDTAPPFLHGRYRQLAFVASTAELEALGTARDEETLVVHSDWLLWQTEIAAGQHAVYYEMGLTGDEWPEIADLDSALFLRANDWLYDGDKDLTIFHGVSLGRLFSDEGSLCLVSFHRLRRSVKALIDRFGPEEILYFDFANDVEVMDAEQRREIAAAIARNRNVRFTVGNHAETSDGRIAENPAAQYRRRAWRDRLAEVYALCLDAASRLTALRRRGPAILVIVNSNMAEPLSLGATRGRLRPIFLGRTLPRRLSLILHCLRSGIRLAGVGRRTLRADDHARLAEIRRDLRRQFETDCDEATAILRRYMQRRVIDTNALEDRAADVLTAETLMRRMRPAQLVLDGVKNPPQAIYGQLAEQTGTEVDYIWHGPKAPDRQRNDGLSGDPRVRPMVTRNLTWGRINEEWLDIVAADQERARVGCPIVARYRQGEAAVATEAEGKPGTALIIQYTPQVDDVRGLNANMYEHFVHVARALEAAGFSDIRIKLHPGAGRWRKEYFEEIARQFGLRCTVQKFEPFSQCVAPAQIVVGPVQTGAMLESLMAGKPYYACLLLPHSLDDHYYRGYPVHADFDSLRAALLREEPGDGPMLLDAFYSTAEITDPVGRFWSVQESARSGSGIPL